MEGGLPGKVCMSRVAQPNGIALPSPPNFLQAMAAIPSEDSAHPRSSDELTNAVQEAVADLAGLIISQDCTASVAITGTFGTLNFRNAPKSASGVPISPTQFTAESCMVDDPTAGPDRRCTRSRPLNMDFHELQRNSNTAAFNTDTGAPFESQQSAPFKRNEPQYAPPASPIFSSGGHSDFQGPRQPLTPTPQSWERSARHNGWSGQSRDTLGTGRLPGQGDGWFQTHPGVLSSPSGMSGPDAAPRVTTYTYDPNGPPNQNASFNSSFSSNAGHAGSWTQQSLPSCHSADSQLPTPMQANSYRQLRNSVRKTCLWAGVVRGDITEGRIPDTERLDCICEGCVRHNVRHNVASIISHLVKYCPELETAIHRSMPPLSGGL